MNDQVEWEYNNYNCDKSLDVIMVAGGGMMNGNAYATIEKENGKYYYCEYGKYPVKKYVGNKIIYDTEDYEYNFNVVDEETDKEKVCKKYDLQVGDEIQLGQCRGGGIATIKAFTEKSIILKNSTSRLTFKSIVKNNYKDIEKNLSSYYH
tara:strand:+ start:60 stop:509 length:450 start_codon:yes stop_codon:yes gene_type:complete